MPMTLARAQRSVRASRQAIAPRRRKRNQRHRQERRGRHEREGGDRSGKPCCPRITRMDSNQDAQVRNAPRVSRAQSFTASPCSKPAGAKAPADRKSKRVLLSLPLIRPPVQHDVTRARIDFRYAVPTSNCPASTAAPQRFKSVRWRRRREIRPRIKKSALTERLKWWQIDITNRCSFTSVDTGETGCLKLNGASSAL